VTHTTPHAPQLLPSPWRFAHVSPQGLEGALHPQTLPEQTCPFPQTRPQLPQLRASLVSDWQPSAHWTRSAGHWLPPAAPLVPPVAVAPPVPPTPPAPPPAKPPVAIPPPVSGSSPCCSLLHPHPTSRVTSSVHFSRARMSFAVPRRALAPRAESSREPARIEARSVVRIAKSVRSARNQSRDLEDRASAPWRHVAAMALASSITGRR
jgi:hypothetical protein